MLLPFVSKMITKYSSNVTTVSAPFSKDEMKRLLSEAPKNTLSLIKVVSKTEGAQDFGKHYFVFKVDNGDISALDAEDAGDAELIEWMEEPFSTTFKLFKPVLPILQQPDIAPPVAVAMEVEDEEYARAIALSMQQPAPGPTAPQSISSDEALAREFAAEEERGFASWLRMEQQLAQRPMPIAALKPTPGAPAVQDTPKKKQALPAQAIIDQLYAAILDKDGNQQVQTLLTQHPGLIDCRFVDANSSLSPLEVAIETDGYFTAKNLIEAGADFYELRNLRSKETIAEYARGILPPAAFDALETAAENKRILDKAVELFALIRAGESLKVWELVSGFKSRDGREKQSHILANFYLDENKQTPLHLAAELNMDNIFLRLLQLGAKLTNIDALGRAPMGIIKSKNDQALTARYTKIIEDARPQASQQVGLSGIMSWGRGFFFSNPTATGEATDANAPLSYRRAQ